jgi:hypothetical protein
MNSKSDYGDSGVDAKWLIPETGSVSHTLKQNVVFQVIPTSYGGTSEWIADM